MEIFTPHPHFKSIDNYSAHEMFIAMKDVITYQEKLWYNCANWEPYTTRIDIDLEKINRLYHFECTFDENDGQSFDMIARMEFNGQPIYVEFVAGMEYFNDIDELDEDFEYPISGIIFICSDVKVFMKLVLQARNFEENKMNLIFDQLRNDGVLIEKNVRDSKNPIFYSQSDGYYEPDFLKNLCYNVVFRNNHLMKNYTVHLPINIIHDLGEYNKYELAKIAYNIGK